jgi:hypothetical protein
MPKLQRSNLPPALLEHLLLRVQQRGISADDLMTLLAWIEKNPTVPKEDWFKRFTGFTICGRGALIKTFLSSDQVAVGNEVD